MNDIFIDNDSSKGLINPLQQEYKDLYIWLINEGVLTVSNHTLTEYGRGNQNLSAIIELLMRKGRLNKVSNLDLKRLAIPKKRNVYCNGEDILNLKTVLLSYRKMALSQDNGLIRTINQWPKYNRVKPLASKNIVDLPYKD